MEKILVSGANGFTGRFVCKELRRRGIKFVALLRPGSDSTWMDSKRIEVNYADLKNPNELARALAGCKAFINLASIGFGDAPSIIAGCNAAKVKRVIFISTTAIFTKINAKSKLIRKSAENSIKESNLDWTILRPTMIYGTPNDRNMIRLVRWLDTWPFIPIFGNGGSLQQPVNVKDVAWSAVEVLNLDFTFYQAFTVSGKDPITYNDVINEVSNQLGKNPLKIFLPLSIVLFCFQSLEKIGIKLPVNTEQIERLNEDKSFSYTKAKESFCYTPRSFKEGISEEVDLYLKSTRNDC